MYLLCLLSALFRAVLHLIVSYFPLFLFEFLISSTVMDLTSTIINDPGFKFSFLKNNLTVNFLLKKKYKLFSKFHLLYPLRSEMIQHVDSLLFFFLLKDKTKTSNADEQFDETELV